MPETAQRFLGEDATRNQLLQAIAANHRQWTFSGARVQRGKIYRENGMTWTCTPGPDGEVTILFPHIRGVELGKRLDAIMRFCYEHQELKSVACWAMDAEQSKDLGVRLLARGFEWGWQPHWMSLDFRNMAPPASLPDNLRIEPVEDTIGWDVADLPYYSPNEAAQMRALTLLRPRRVWHFAAYQDNRPVGHSVLNLTTGRLGVAGIYNVGVIPPARNRGIGAAITLAACRFAQTLGCRHAVLNATGMGERVYRRIGFESLGCGMTWWLHCDVLEAGPIAANKIAFTEATGFGDVERLERTGKNMPPAELDAPLACGMTPLELAVKTNRPTSAEWLLQHGATLDVLSAWDMGWKDRARRILTATPELANRKTGKGQFTPLHEAVARDDLELAQLLLSAHPDTDIRDGMFNSTPLGWAQHFQRHAMIKLIEQYREKS